MTSRTKAIILGALLLLLAAMLIIPRLRSNVPESVAQAADTRFKPVDVDNPALRMDILQRFMNLEYRGVKRNIFSATPPPPPPPKTPPVVAQTGPVVPPGPPPLTV